MLARVEFGVVGRTRGTGRAGSAVAASAYNASEKMEATDGTEYDFTRKKGEHQGGSVLLPPGAPPELADPATLWRAAEACERRSDAQLARQLLISIPREVAAEDRQAFAEHMVAPYVADGAACQVDVHCPMAADGQAQPHAHVLMSLRRVNDDGFAKTKAREWNTQFREGNGKAERERLATRATEWLKQHGVAEPYDLRSRADRDDPTPPEPTAPRADWQRWLREGAAPRAAPITVAAVLDHRERRGALARADQAQARATQEVAELTRERDAAHQATTRPSTPPAAPQAQQQAAAPSRQARREDPRAAARRTLDQAEARARATLAGAPRGSTDPARLAGPRLAELADRRRTARTEAMQAQGAADQHRRSHSWWARLTSPGLRHAQVQMDNRARCQAAIADRLDRSQNPDAKQARQDAARQARANAQAREDWRWNPDAKGARTTLDQVGTVRRAVMQGNREATQKAAQGDLAGAVEASTRPGARPTQDPRAAAVTALHQAEGQHARDPRALARARLATGAALAGDPATIEAAARGDLAGAQQAGAAWQRQQEQARQARQAVASTAPRAPPPTSGSRGYGPA